jgi:hypothetical protein
VRNFREEVNTDDSGFFAICGIPAGRPVRLSAARGGQTSREASLIFPNQLGGALLMAWDKPPGKPYEYEFLAPDPVWKLDLTLGTHDIEVVGRASSMLHGIVTDRHTGRPLDGATVIVNGVDTTTTRDDGTFDLPSIRWMLGANRVEFRRSGYESLTWDLWLDEDESELSVSATLLPVPVRPERLRPER